MQNPIFSPSGGEEHTDVLFASIEDMSVAGVVNASSSPFVDASDRYGMHRRVTAKNADAATKAMFPEVGLSGIRGTGRRHNYGTDGSGRHLDRQDQNSSSCRVSIRCCVALLCPDRDQAYVPWTIEMSRSAMER